jgi:hypothetical protein
MHVHLVHVRVHIHHSIPGADWAAFELGTSVFQSCERCVHPDTSNLWCDSPSRLAETQVGRALHLLHWTSVRT